MSKSIVVAVLVAAALIAACSPAPNGSQIVIQLQQPATLEALLGEWQPSPFELDPAMRARILEACIRDMQDAIGAKAAVIDVRGRGVATVRLTGPHSGSCDALEIVRDGHVQGAGGGWVSFGGEEVDEPAGATISNPEVQGVLGGELKVTGRSVYGRAGPGIAVVTVQAPGVPLMRATLENGWFGAWWPADIGDGSDPARNAHFTVRAYDAAGTLRDTAQR